MVKILIFIASLGPLGYWIAAAMMQSLGTDPAKTLVLATGTWTFYFLLLTLSISPLRTLWPKLRKLIKIRRMLGLFTLFYALLHGLAFWAFILNFDVGRLGDELIKRTYIVLTLPALILLLAMGVTSTQAMMKRLGKRWILLHRSIYAVAILAWLHVFFQVRASYQDAVIFGIAVGILLGIRLYWRLQRQAKY
jgi:methionine sulfoxide reductase heme-binding subunit